MSNGPKRDEMPNNQETSLQVTRKCLKRQFLHFIGVFIVFLLIIYYEVIEMSKFIQLNVTRKIIKSARNNKMITGKKKKINKLITGNKSKNY